jgi:hypothetical protein
MRIGNNYFIDGILCCLCCPSSVGLPLLSFSHLHWFFRDEIETEERIAVNIRLD